MSSPEITIFTAPKPFKDPHISIIQYNAFRSWKELEPNVSIVIVGDEFGIGSVAKELNIPHEPRVQKNELGTPLISSIFDIGRSQNSSDMLAYINADIIVFDDLLNTAKQIYKQFNKFLIVGQRWDLEVQANLDFLKNWEIELKNECNLNGKLHPRGGSDYFIYPRNCFEKLPDFAVGRAGWDNWMFFQARKEKWACIDATKSIQIIHQNHDYSHLPGGQSHYRLPETNENIRLAGGRRTIFTLLDVNYEYKQGRVKKSPLNFQKFWREVEIFPLITLNSLFLAQIAFGILHPNRAYKEFRKWLETRKKGKE